VAVSSSIKLKPADPFDLIRWLARSQSDPRKALAELVQNSLDANAPHVWIERRRVRRSPALVIRDDGEGIVPEMARDEALRAIATNIGHSRKRGLSPRERHERVVAGKYGIGLLGRWRSRFNGHRWQVNASHEDYIALRGEPRTRLRYLLALFAKEVAFRAHGVPGSEEALESLVEILAHAERNLSGAG